MLMLAAGAVPARDVLRVGREPARARPNHDDGPR
ncbi:MAG: hypothetical protein KatS3mg122_0768 [Caldimonas sp.]|nr:MAG: hypothetical protein KatS3mg122_0768 [Caldimonas sp.]